MKSKLYSLLEQGILKKPRKALITYRSLIEPINADTTIGQFTLHGVISNDDPTIALSDTINLYPSVDADHPYRTITVDIDPVKEVTSVFYTLINPDNDFNLNCTINHIELISEQGNIPIGLGILEPEALAATSITATGFIANWTEIDEATGYKIDVSTDLEFTTFVSGYENKDIPSGATVSLAVTGLSEDVCYFYRVRAYNATFTSMNSNEIHVGDIVPVISSGVKALAYNLPNAETFNTDYIRFFNNGTCAVTRTGYSNTSATRSIALYIKFNESDIIYNEHIIYSRSAEKFASWNNCERLIYYKRIFKYILYNSSGSIITEIHSNIPIVNDSLYHSVVLVIDNANIVVNDRVRIYIDGVSNDTVVNADGGTYATTSLYDRIGCSYRSTVSMNNHYCQISFDLKYFSTSNTVMSIEDMDNFSKGLYNGNTLDLKPPYAKPLSYSVDATGCYFASALTDTSGLSRNMNIILSALNKPYYGSCIELPPLAGSYSTSDTNQAYGFGWFIRFPVNDIIGSFTFSFKIYLLYNSMNRFFQCDGDTGIGTHLNKSSKFEIMSSNNILFYENSTPPASCTLDVNTGIATGMWHTIMYSYDHTAEEMTIKYDDTYSQIYSILIACAYLGKMKIHNGVNGAAYIPFRLKDVIFRSTHTSAIEYETIRTGTESQIATLSNIECYTPCTDLPSYEPMDGIIPLKTYRNIT